MTNSILRAIISLLIMGYVFTGCSSDDNSGVANNIVACKLDDFNQCAEWINLIDPLVGSLSSTCVNDDNGIIVDSCPLENLIGICEQLDDPVTPDLLNYFYLSPTATDPVAYALVKEQACNDVGGVWNPAN